MTKTNKPYDIKPRLDPSIFFVVNLSLMPRKMLIMRFPTTPMAKMNSTIKSFFLLLFSSWTMSFTVGMSTISRKLSWRYFPEFFV